MAVYQVVQGFFNPRLCVEGKYEEYLDMDKTSMEKIGKQYFKPVSKELVDTLLTRGIKPRKVTIVQRGTTKKMTRSASNKMETGADNK